MALSVKLNQITIFQISDHYTRNKIQDKHLSQRVIGALIGKQEGRFLSISTATELGYVVNKNSDEIDSLDLDYLQRKIDLLKQVYQLQEFVGWYFCLTSKHDKLTAKDLEIHKKLQNYNDNLILLTIDPTKNMLQTKQLAANTYEMKLDPVLKKEMLNEVQFEIDVDPSETITVESVLKDLNFSKTSQFAESLSTMLSSIKTLENKLQKLLVQIEDKQSNLHKNPKLLIELKEVLNAFPTKKHSIMDLRLLDQGCETNITNFLQAILGVNKMIMNVQSQKNGFESKFIRKYDNMF